jgi:hypothetical protein
MKVLLILTSLFLLAFITLKWVRCRLFIISFKFRRIHMSNHLFSMSDLKFFSLYNMEKTFGIFISSLVNWWYQWKKRSKCVFQSIQKIFYFVRFSFRMLREKSFCREYFHPVLEIHLCKSLVALWWTLMFRFCLPPLGIVRFSIPHLHALSLSFISWHGTKHSNFVCVWNIVARFIMIIHYCFCCFWNNQATCYFCNCSFLLFVMSPELLLCFHYVWSELSMKNMLELSFVQLDF